jgi:hypothetical protein
MDDIIRYDVRTYLEALNEKEFTLKKNEEKVLSGTGNTMAGVPRHGRHHPLLQSRGRERTASNSGGKA